MDLREEIELAFTDTPYPGDDNIAGPNDEGTLEYFSGKTWKGHSARELRKHSSSLYFLTPDAFRYFLPAYMVAAVEQPDEADIISLTIALEFSRWRFDRQCQELFTKPELRAIVRFFDDCAVREMNHDAFFRQASFDARRSLEAR